MMNKPEETIHTGLFTWCRAQGDYYFIGLSGALFNDYREVYSVEWPEEGTVFEKDGDFITVETEQGYVEIYAPFSGQIYQINDELVENPGLINEDPYGAGWLVLAEKYDEDFLNLLVGDSENEKNR